MLKKVLIASAILASASVGALAADLPEAVTPVVPAYSWTGFYIGGHAGYGFSAENEIETKGQLQGNINNVNAGARPADVTIDDDEGFIGGGQIGFNYQVASIGFGALVVGVEADISYTDVEGETSYFSPVDFLPAAPAGTQSDFAQSLDYLGTVRGRVGLGFDRLLVYGTGGFAYGKVNYDVNFFCLACNAGGPGLQFQGDDEKTATGYAVGGGFEYALPAGFNPFGSGDVTLKAEYLYYNLGKETIDVPVQPGVSGAGGYDVEFETSGHIVRGGLNFKFNSLF